MIRVLFFGTPAIAVPTLTKLLSVPDVVVAAVISQPDRPAGRGKELRASPVKEVAARHHIPILTPTSLRKEEEAVFAALQPLGPFDVGVVFAFGQILTARMLTLPRHGCINIHTSLLPRWRGAAPLQRAIMAGDSRTGITLMQMDVGLDTGPILVTEELPIHTSTTFGDLHDEVANRGAELLCRNLLLLVSGAVTPTPQPLDGVTLAPKITDGDCKIDWSRTADDIRRQIHGVSPFPGAYTFIEGVRVKIFRVATYATSESAPPGTVVARGEALHISCGSGEVRVLEAQREGRGRVSGAELLRGSPKLRNALAR